MHNKNSTLPALHPDCRESFLFTGKRVKSMVIFRLLTCVAMVILFSSVLSAQQETYRWEKKERKQTVTPHLHTGHSYSFADILYTVYQEVISKPDGDKCGFAPSCSSFGVEMLKHTNPVSAVLLTGDRLLRDTNLFGRKELYPRKNSKYSDFPALYYYEVEHP